MSTYMHMSNESAQKSGYTPSFIEQMTQKDVGECHFMSWYWQLTIDYSLTEVNVSGVLLIPQISDEPEEAWDSIQVL